MWSLNIMLAFWSLIFSHRVPIWADINFFNCNTVSVGQHLIRWRFPMRSFTTTSIITGAYELCTSLPYRTKSRTWTCFVAGKYDGLLYFGYPQLEQVLVRRLKVFYLHLRQLTWVFSGKISSSSRSCLLLLTTTSSSCLFSFFCPSLSLLLDLDPFILCFSLYLLYALCLYISYWSNSLYSSLCLLCFFSFFSSLSLSLSFSLPFYLDRLRSISNYLL